VEVQVLSGSAPRGMAAVRWCQRRRGDGTSGGMYKVHRQRLRARTILSLYLTRRLDLNGAGSRLTIDYG
jgi:hypothetical protein